MRTDLLRWLASLAAGHKSKRKNFGRFIEKENFSTKSGKKEKFLTKEKKNRLRLVFEKKFMKIGYAFLADHCGPGVMTPNLFAETAPLKLPWLKPEDSL